MNTGPRILYASVAGLGAGGLAYYGVNKWGLTPGKKEETAMFAGLAIAVIVWLLLGSSPAIEDQPAVAPDQTSSAPIPIVIGPTQLTTNLTQAPTHGNCDCGCGQIDTGLSDLFTKLANTFSVSLQKNQDDYQSALMASVPNWLAGVTSIGGEHDVASYNIFSPTPGVNSVTQIAPGVVKTVVWA